jgi:hypothetical protein
MANKICVEALNGEGKPLKMEIRNVNERLKWGRFWRGLQ